MLLFALIGAGFMLFAAINLTYPRVEEAMRGAQQVERFAQIISRYPSVPARIIHVGYQSGWHDPDFKPRGLTAARKRGDNEEADRIVIESLRKTEKRIRNLREKHGINIRYEYQIDGETYTSGQIAPVLVPEDASLVHQYAPGDDVTIKVHPDKPALSYLLPKSPYSAQHYEKMLTWSMLRICVLISSIIIGSFAAYFSFSV